MNASRRTLPEQSIEAVYNEAFLRAYRVTRASYGYFGIFRITGNEVEMLELLTNEVLNREILDDHLAVSTAVMNAYVYSTINRVSSPHNLLVVHKSGEEEQHISKRPQCGAENSETDRPFELA